MSRSNRQDIPFISKNLDMPTGNRNRRKKKKNLNVKDRRIISIVDGHTQAKIDRSRRLMYIDSAVGNGSPVTIPQNSTSAFGVSINPTAISVGNSQANRIADQIWLKRLEVKVKFTYNFAASSFAQDLVNQIRMTIFIWKPNSAADAVTPAQIYQNVSSTSTMAHFDFELQNQFRIIADEYIYVSGFGDATTSYANPNPRSGESIIKSFSLGNTLLRFTPGTTTASNHLYITFTSDTVTGPAPLIYGIFRTEYYNDSA